MIHFINTRKINVSSQGLPRGSQGSILIFFLFQSYIVPGASGGKLSLCFNYFLPQGALGGPGGPMRGPMGPTRGCGSGRAWRQESFFYCEKFERRDRVAYARTADQGRWRRFSMGSALRALVRDLLLVHQSLKPYLQVGRFFYFL